MFNTVRQIRAAILARRQAAEPIDIEEIFAEIKALSIIDSIVFVEYDVPASNPIWGQFYRFSQRPSVYSALDTIVEVRYAKHLNECWRRFVVVKELCHALEDTEGTHTATSRSIDNLIGTFALMSTAQAPEQKLTLGFQAEMLAEVAAIELLCPMSERREMLASGEYQNLGAMGVAQKFKIPAEHVPLAFTESHMDTVEILLNP